MKRYLSYKMLSTLMIAAVSILALPVRAEITLNLLTWEGYSPPQQVEQFKQLVKSKYGETLNFNITYITSAEEYFTSIRRGKADIIVPSHNIIKDERYKLISAKLILPIDINNIPNYTKILPSLQKAEYAVQGNKVYTVPLVHGPYGLAYNADKISPAPDSWSVLWDTKNKGNYAISSDYHEANIYVTALSLGFKGSDISNIKKLSDKSVKSKLKQLVQNANNLWVGVDSADDFEKISLGAAWGFSFPELKNRGQNWKMADPKEGTTSWVDGHAISKTLADKPKHKRIVEEWINFTLSDNFQLNAIVRGIGSAPVNTSIKDKLTANEVKKLHLDDPDYFKNNRILWPTLSSRQRNFMKILWKGALKPK